MHKIFYAEKSMLRSSRIRSWRKSARLTIHPIYMHSRRKSFPVNRERGERERGQCISLPNASSASDTPEFRFPPFVEGTAAAVAVTGPACHYLIFIHSAHCFWITGCPPLHSSSPIFTRGQPWFTSAPKYVSQNVLQPIVFRIDRRLSL